MWGPIRNRPFQSHAARSLGLLLTLPAAFAGACSDPSDERLASEQQMLAAVMATSAPLRTDRAIIVIDPADCFACNAPLQYILYARRLNRERIRLVYSRPPTKRERADLNRRGLLLGSEVDTTPRRLGAKAFVLYTEPSEPPRILTVEEADDLIGDQFPETHTSNVTR